MDWLNSIVAFFVALFALPEFANLLALIGLNPPV